MATVGSVLKGIVSGKSVQTLGRAPVGNELGILKVSAVTWGEFRPSECKAMPLGYEPGDCPRPMDGDILISRANTRELVGAPVMVRGDHPQLLLSDKLLKLIPDEEVVDPRYLVRVLRSPAAMAHFFRRAGGSSGSMTNITQADIREAAIHLPTLADQRRIAVVLDLADAIKAKRMEILAQLDRLAQAIFVEMFGNLMAPTARWKHVPVAAFVAGFESGKSVAADDEEDAHSPYRVLKVSAVTSLEFKPLESKAAPPLHKPKASHFVRAGDLLFSRANTTELIGATAYVFDTPENVLLPDKLWRFVWHQTPRATPHFVNYLFRQSKFRAEISRRASGSSGSMKNISQDKVLTICVALPPAEMQQRFAERIEKIELLRRLEQSGNQRWHEFFSSLQQRAFRGEF
jgi:type I restriction enzyme S subunit